MQDVTWQYRFLFSARKYTHPHTHTNPALLNLIESYTLVIFLTEIFKHTKINYFEISP